MMIEVNLLPAELRRVEHTPLPRFLVIITGTALVMATTAFGVVINLRKVPDLNAKMGAVSKEVTECQPAAGVYDKLQDEISDAKARKQAIAELWRTRIQWSRKLTQLAQMTPGYVGFTAIKLDEARAGGMSKEQETGGMLTLESLIATADLDRLATWRRIVGGEVRLVNQGDDVGKSFYSAFLDLLPTDSTKVDVKEDYVQKEALKVALKMPLKPSSARLSEALQAAQEAIKRDAPVTPASDKPGRRPRPAQATPATGTTPAPVETPAAPEDDTKKTPAASIVSEIPALPQSGTVAVTVENSAR